MAKCQCHVIGRVYTDMEALAADYLADYTAMAQLCSFITMNSTVLTSLHRHQIMNDLTDLNIVLANETRWEGRDAAIKRFIELEESLQ